MLYRGSTAQETWDRLKAIFQDYKHTRAVYLENQFNTLHLSNFADINAYCQQLKSIRDQLANVDQVVSDQKMFLRLVAGLVNTDFDTVALMIQQTDPIPTFESARSRLLLEESRKANDTSTSSSTFVAQTVESRAPPSSSPSALPPQPRQGVAGGGRGGGRGRSGNRGGNYRGRGRGRGNQQPRPAHNSANWHPTAQQQIQWASPLPSPHQWAQFLN